MFHWDTDIAPAEQTALGRCVLVLRAAGASETIRKQIEPNPGGTSRPLPGQPVNSGGQGNTNGGRAAWILNKS